MAYGAQLLCTKTSDDGINLVLTCAGSVESSTTLAALAPFAASGVEIDCTIALEDVSEVRRLVEKSQRRLGSSDADAARVAMATHVLLENAIKFSVDGTVCLRIEVTANDEVRIHRRNRASADDRHDLAVLAAELAAAADPTSFYVSLMGRAPNARGGLGLGRIVAEGDMSIGFVFHDDVVEMHASSALAA